MRHVGGCPGQICSVFNNSPGWDELGGMAPLTFHAKRSSLARMNKLRVRCTITSDPRKVGSVDAGMKEPSGSRNTAFATPRDAQRSIMTTSPIKITTHARRVVVVLAVRALYGAYELGEAPLARSRGR